MGHGLSKPSCCLNQSVKNQEVSIDETNNRINPVVRIQSVFRGYLLRKYISKKFNKRLNKQISNNSEYFKENQILDSTSSQNADSLQVKEIGYTYNTSHLENNPKIIQLSSLLPKFQLDERENYLISTSNMQTTGLMYADNSIYKGTVNATGKREGFGKYFLQNGSIYEGFFKDNKMEGRGRMISTSGFVYDGLFHNSKANGYGKLVTLDGTIYKGNWLNDKQNGVGYQIYPDKSYYVGNFINGLKNGKGALFFKDGQCYQGYFSDNEIKGEGIRKWKDGRIYYGKWDKNKMNGYGLFYWPDNKKYYGHYYDGIKDGFGIFLWNDGKIYEGLWKEGKQNGYGIITKNNEKKYGIWEKGKLIKYIDNLEEISTVNKCIEGFKQDNAYTEFMNKKEKYEKEIGISG
ncbi:MAG: hypothetical protein MJ252_30955 [archaeon]|nr:hypothetical protein [archaeon]